MSRNSGQSAKLYERATRSVPSGVHSSTRARVPHPAYFQRAEGGIAWDVDGNRWIDLIMGNGAVILGHGDERVNRSIERALKAGLSTGLEWETSVEIAERFLAAVPTMDLVRFTNTGTEAAMHAAHVARHHTGKVRLAKMEGSYHGWSDELFVSCWPDVSLNGSLDAPTSLAGSKGLHPAMVESTLILPFNDVGRTAALLARHAHELAAVILEPVMIDIGFIPATPAYLKTLRELCNQHGIALIFDELLTGFRLAPGGAQEAFGIVPDLAIYGKVLANGFPMAALAGSEELMRQTEPGKGPVFVGTFNGHVLPLAAAQATLPLLAEGEIQRILDKRTERLVAAFDRAAAEFGVDAQLCGRGGHLHWYFTSESIHDYRSAYTTHREAYAAFNATLGEHGVLTMANPLSHHALSLAHDEAILDELSDVFRHGLKAVAAL